MAGRRIIVRMQAVVCLGLLISPPALAKDGRSGLDTLFGNFEDNSNGNSGNGGGSGNSGNGNGGGNGNSGNGSGEGNGNSGEDNSHRWWGWMAAGKLPGTNISNYTSFDDFLHNLPPAHLDDATRKNVPIKIDFDVNNCTALTSTTTDLKALARMLVATFGLGSDSSDTEVERIQTTTVDSAVCNNSHVTIHLQYLALKDGNPADILESLVGSASAIIPLSIQAQNGFRVTSDISITPTWEGSNWLADLGVNDTHHGDDNGAEYLRTSIANVSTDDVTSVVPIHIQFVTPACMAVNALAENAVADFSAAVRLMVAKRAQLNVSRVRYNQESCVGSLAIIDLDWLVTSDIPEEEVNASKDLLASGFGCMRARFLQTQGIPVVPGTLSTACDDSVNGTAPRRQAPRKAYTVPLTMTINASATLASDKNLQALFKDQWLSPSLARSFGVLEDQVDLHVEYETPGRRRQLLQTSTTVKVSGTVDGVTIATDALQATVAGISSTAGTTVSTDLISAFGITGISASATVQSASPSPYTSDVPFTMHIVTAQSASTLAASNTFKTGLISEIATYFAVDSSHVSLSLSASAAAVRRNLLQTSTVSATGSVSGLTTDSTTLQSLVNVFNTDPMVVLSSSTVSTFEVAGVTASAQIVASQTSPTLSGTHAAISLLVTSLMAVCALLAMV